MASLSPRSAMDTVPHVATQWQSGQISKEGLERKRAHRQAKASSEYLRPIISPNRSRQRGAKSVSSLSLLATPENERWDFGSIRHIRQHSSDAYTPISAVDSIFELPSGEAFGSPNSSNHSSFIAELEDTSPIALAKFSPLISSDKSPVFPYIIAQPTVSNPRMEFKTADITSRAVIKVVDETIAAIEDTNRKLLSRAVAAEEAAKSAEEAARTLREQNSQLQLKIKQYGENQERPKTAPSQPRRPRYKYTPTSSSGPTPLSAFNTSIDQLVLNKPQPPKPTRPSQPHYPSVPLSPARVDIGPGDPFRIHNFPSPTPQQQKRPIPTPLPLKSHSRCHSHTDTPALEISNPIPGSVTRHEVTYDGAPLNTYGTRAKIISLDEARRRTKPLPLSPGVVESDAVGLNPLGWDREGMEERDKGKNKRGFSALFCRRRARENVF